MTTPARTAPRRPAANGQPDQGPARSVSRLEYLVLAVVAFVPQLLSRVGVVDTDTKTYLYLEPGRLLRQSTSMWNPQIGLGTVTHEAIGYLWPMGPFFWAARALGIPLWAAQRLWVGALLFAAGAGVLYLCRVVGLRGPGRFVAAFAFMLSPYFLQYVGRISVILIPWAGLGWLTAFVILAVRHRDWRYPALFALTWLTISGTNATGAIYAGVAPVLWLLYVRVTREHTWREVWTAAWRCGVLAIGVSLWWAEALVVEGKYGLRLLDYTEQPSHVANSSLASEVLRGLGYWYYYGFDGGGPWAATSTGYAQHLWLIFASFGVPLLAIGAAVAIRWRRRAYFVVLALVAMVLAVGAHPYNTPSAFGALAKSFMRHSTAGLALRSTDRATPLLVLGLAMLLGAGVTALVRRRRAAGLVVAVVTVGLVAAANPSVWDGGTVPSRYTMPDPLPSYVRDAATTLNATHLNTRVLAIPGENSAAYSWGDTIDPVWPGILTRPYESREQFPLGSLAGYSVLYGLDVPMQNGTMDPRAIAPLARLLSAGDIILQSDLNFGLFAQPNPQRFWAALQPTPAGLSAPVAYGAAVPVYGHPGNLDSRALAASPSLPWPAPIEVYTVPGARPLVRAETASDPLVVDGDGTALAALAADGLLDTSSAVLYGPTLQAHRSLLPQAESKSATLVVTDSNRKQLYFWSRIQENAGLMLSASDANPSAPLDIFGNSPVEAQTTEQTVGVTSVEAVPAVPKHAPIFAVEGIPGAAWETPAGVVPLSRWWQVRLTRPVSTGTVTLAQPVVPDYETQQWITRATLTFDGNRSLEVTLGPASRSAAGQVIHFSPRTFRTLRVTIDKTNLATAPASVVKGASPVGLAHVAIPGVQGAQIIAMPSDLLRNTSATNQSNRVLVVMTRERVANPPETDPEPVLARSFSLPAARNFTVSGTVRADTAVPDSTVDSVLGRTGPVSAYSSERLTGTIKDTAAAALDGDPATMWSPGFGAATQHQAWLQVNSGETLTVDHLDLQVVADGRHSVPTELRISSCDSVPQGGTCPGGNDSLTVSLPGITDSHAPNATTSVHVAFPAMTGRDFTVSFPGVRIERTRNYQTSAPISLPLGIAELGLPGVQAAPVAASVSASCRSDLLAIDGTPVPVRVTGTTAAAVSGAGLQLSLCGAGATGMPLARGTHVVTAAPGTVTGLDVDQLVLDSAPGGSAAPAPAADGTLAATTAPAAPSVHVRAQGSTAYTVHVTGARGPFWLVLGQSVNKGWQATVGGGHSRTSVLVDGYANGWLIQPPAGGHGSSFVIHLTWTPQGTVNLALVASALVILLCLALVLWPRRRQHAMAAAEHPTWTVTTAGGVRGLDPPPAMGLAVAVGGVAAVFVPTLAEAVLAFLIVFFTVLLALLAPVRRSALRVVAVAFAAAALIYTLVEEATQHFPASGWLAHFERASQLVWLSVVLLGADLGVGWILRRRGSTEGGGRR